MTLRSGSAGKPSLVLTSYFLLIYLYVFVDEEQPVLGFGCKEVRTGPKAGSVPGGAPGSRRLRGRSRTGLGAQTLAPQAVWGSWQLRGFGTGC